MDLSKTPSPIVYALALIISVIGTAAGYRIFKGSSFEYQGVLGNIQLQAGEENLTLGTFVQESQEALHLAQAKIREQEQVIDSLERKLQTYQNHQVRSNAPSAPQAPQGLAIERVVSVPASVSVSASKVASEKIHKQLKRYLALDLKQKIEPVITK